MSQVVSGTVSIEEDGIVGDVVGEITLNLGVSHLNLKEDMNGQHGLEESYQKSWVSCSRTLFKELDVKALLRKSNVTIIVRQASGANYIFYNMTYTEKGDLNPSKGEIPVMFSGPHEGEVI